MAVVRPRCLRPRYTVSVAGPYARPLENPVVPRMDYVARNYSDFVTMAVFGAWAEATGRHDLRQELGRIFHTSAEDAPTALLQLPILLRRYRAPTATRYDRYLPWLARELNRIYKPYARHVKRKEAPAFPPGYDFAHRLVTHQPRDQPVPVGLTIARLATYTRDLQNVFRVIVDWAEAESVDLTSVKWREAEERSLEWGQRRRLEALSQGVVVYEFPDGWTVQELTTAQQLEDEGEVMQHCVGEYGPRGVGVVFRIYSLRDPKGQPHATMEWNIEDGTVAQLKGKQNVLPDLRYLLRMVPFRRDVLDLRAKVRPLSQFQPGVLAWFREDYLGAWAFNPRGTLRDLIGQHGALEQAMRDDVVYVVYERDEVTKVYALAELNVAVDDVMERYLENAPNWLDFDDDAQVSAYLDEALRQWAQDTWAGTAGAGPVGPEYTAPGLDWAVWSATDYFPEREDDEMVEDLQLMGVISNDPRIVQGREPIEVIKRRVLS